MTKQSNHSPISVWLKILKQKVIEFNYFPVISSDEVRTWRKASSRGCSVWSPNTMACVPVTEIKQIKKNLYLTNVLKLKHEASSHLDQSSSVCTTNRW